MQDRDRRSTTVACIWHNEGERKPEFRITAWLEQCGIEGQDREHLTSCSGDSLSAAKFDAEVKEAARWLQTHLCVPGVSVVAVTNAKHPIPCCRSAP